MLAFFYIRGMKMFTHQMQPTRNSCVSTCLAMLANKPAQEVIDTYHDRYWENPIEIISILSELDIVAVPCSVHGSTVYWGQLYLFSMPSLNIEGGTHQIIVDMRDPVEAAVLDPAFGRQLDSGEPAKYYTIDTVFKTIWIPEWRILDCPATRGV